MFNARGVGLAKNVAYPLKIRNFLSNKVTSRKSKELWTKDPEWNYAAYEEKENSYYFAHPAQYATNSHPHFKAMVPMVDYLLLIIELVMDVPNDSVYRIIHSSFIKNRL